MDHGSHGHHHHHVEPSTTSSPLESMGHEGHTTGMPPMDGGCPDMMGHSMMSMAFHFGHCETVLFDAWRVSSVGTLIGSMVGIFIMAALYEGLKYYREYLFWRSNNSIQYRSVTPPEKGSTEENTRVVTMIPEIIHRQPPSMLSGIHVLQTVLHIIQIVLSYFLMLIFMTYNVWLCIAVVLGAAVGYFLFGWKKSVIVDVTEHCH